MWGVVPVAAFCFVAAAAEQASDQFSVAMIVVDFQPVAPPARCECFR
jgi:hypothetical protein